MKEPSLLDVVKSIVTGPRLLRSLLVVVGLFLAYRGMVALGLSQVVPVLLVSLGILLAIAALRFRWPSSLSVTAPGTAITLPKFRVGAGGRVAVRSLLGLFYAGLGLLLAYIAQVQWFQHPQQPWTGIVLWAVAVACWVPLLLTRPAIAPVAVEAVEPRVNRQLALGGFGLAVVAFWLSGVHLYTGPVVLTWLLSVVVWCAALLGWRTQDLSLAWAKVANWVKVLDLSGVRIRLTWTAIAFMAILGLGTFLRFYQLNAVPREMTSDHAEKLLDVNDVLHGQFGTFFPRNTGREPLQFYVAASLIHFLNFPLGYITLKVTTALAGSVMLIFVFLLARELAGTEVALLAMLLTAVARWAIAISRIGLRPTLDPLFVAPTFYFLARGLKSGRRSDFVWAGLIVAIGLHGYTSFQVIPVTILLIGGVWLAWDWLRRNRTLTIVRQQAFNLGALFSVATIASVPLLRYTTDNPEMFWFRALSRATNAGQPIIGNPLIVLLTNIYRAMLMFNFFGDQVWVANISSWPTLSSLMAALFGLGLLFFVIRAARGDRWAGMAIIVWFMTLMPSAASLTFPNENPSVTRAGGAAPFVFLMAAWPLVLLRREIVKRVPGWSGQLLGAGALVLIVAGAARTDFQDYFTTYRDQYAQSVTNSSEVAAQIRAFVAAGGDPSQVWLKGYPYWLDLRLVAIEAFGNFDWQNAVLDVDKLTAIGNDPRAKLVIVHVFDRPAIAKLRQLYPHGILAFHKSATPGKDFLTYFVPGSQDFDENTLPPPQ